MRTFTARTQSFYQYHDERGERSGVADQNTHTSTLRDVEEFSLGFGTDIYGKLSFGGAVNIYFGGGTAQYSDAFSDTVPLVFGDLVTDTVRSSPCQRSTRRNVQYLDSILLAL